MNDFGAQLQEKHREGGSMSGSTRDKPLQGGFQRTLESHEQDELRRLWAEGLASGPGRFDDIEAIKREARRQREA
jgi:antitoxin ParD1/3/4